VNIANFKREDLIVGGIAVLLIIDLLFIPWYSESFSAGAFSASISVVGTDAPDGFAGILALIGSIAVLAEVLVRNLASGVQIPVVGGSAAITRLILAGIAAGFALLKMLLQIGHLGDWGFGFWLGLVLCAGLLFVSLQGRNATA
jgi:hypothetical protein